MRKAGQEFSAKHQFVQRVVTKKEAIVGSQVNADAKWDGGAKIVMNATDILDAFMARANVHGNVPVNQAGEACFAIKN